MLVLGLALTLIAVVGWFLVVDESTDCSGHIDELLRKGGWVS